MGALRRRLAYEELRDEPRLRLACAAFLLFYCHSFGAWHADSAAMLSTYGLETGNIFPTRLVAALCGPVFPAPFWTLLHLALLYFTGLFGLLLLFRRECFGAMLILAFLFLNKAYYYLSDLRLAADFHHIHLLLTALFLFAKDKLFFLRAGLVASYLLLAGTKLNSSWLGGEYFLSLPEFPRALAVLCPLWVAWAALGPLLWFSRSRPARVACVGIFAAAHAAFAIARGPDFSILMLPILLVLFWDPAQPLHAGYRFQRAQLPAWLVLAAGLAVGVPPSEDNRAASARVVVEKGEKRMVFAVEWPWARPTRLIDGATAAAGVPSYQGEYHEGGLLRERLPWHAVVRDGPRLIFNPYAFLTLPNRLVGPTPLRLWGRRLCREYRPDRLSLRLDVRRDGRLESELVLDSPDFCKP